MPKPDVTLRTPAVRNMASALVVGAGVAGAAIADALVQRGVRVQVLERDDAPAGGPSGNPSALIRPVIARRADDPLARFYSTAARYAVARVNRLKTATQADVVIQRGAHWVCAHHAKLDTREIACEHLTPDVALQRVGVPCGEGLWLPDALSLRPSALCHALLYQPGISLHTGAAVADISTENNRCVARDANGNTLAEADACVLTTGPSMPTTLPDLAPPWTTTQGLAAVAAAPAGASPLQANLAGSDSFAPMTDGVAVNTGHWRAPRTLTAATAELALPAALADHRVASARLATRLHTPDRLPLIGAAPDVTASRAALEPLKRGKSPEQDPVYRPNIYLIAGLGGRGVTSAMWSAELLARAMLGLSDCPPSLHPLRFLVRALRRGG